VSGSGETHEVWVVTSSDSTHGNSIRSVHRTEPGATEVGVPEAFRQASQYHGGSLEYAPRPGDPCTFYQVRGGTIVHIERFPLRD
jgi:hypothetical protein